MAHRQCGDDRGAVVGMTIGVALLVSLLAVVFHFLVVGHVRHVVELHVDAAVLDAASFDGSEADGIDRARTGLEAETGWLDSFVVSATRSTEFTTVRVEAETIEVLAWLGNTIVVERTRATERAGP